MYKKCDANCDATHQNLWLRGNIFYYRVELPREDKKRRYKRISLHTGNFFEAREIIKSMTMNNNKEFERLRFLFSHLIFENEPCSPDGLGMLTRFQLQKRLSKRNNPEDIAELYMFGVLSKKHRETNLSAEDRKLLQDILDMKPLFEAYLASQPKPSNPTSAPSPSRKISEVLDNMLIKGNNCASVSVRKKNMVKKLLQVVGLTLKDDYSSFHNADTIMKIAKYIADRTDIKGDAKRTQLRYIKELATCGSNIDPNTYNSSILNNLPKIEKTKKSEKKPYLPYSNAQLLEIFNPKYDYFKKNPDAFFACLIALFTGSRANASITLQYDDVLQKDGIDCIQFVENHPIKHLKNEASERIVPIHQQLLDVGFVDYVRRRQKRLDAKGSDFIFPKCQSKNGTYNNKYVSRVILSFITTIGVKSNTKDQHDFHSFRKNASVAMQDAGIIPTYINDIIGWEGKNTMEQSYSNHTLAQIKKEMSKFNYDFLQPHFDKWKEIMKNAK